MAFLTALLDVTGEKGRTEEAKQEKKNNAYALPHDLGETMTIKWPAADVPLSLSPSLSLSLSFSVYFDVQNSPNP